MSETLSRERLEEALAECAVDNPASSDDLGAHIAALEAENERLEAAYMDMGARAAGFEYTVRHLEEENAELRAELKRTDEMFARAAADEQLYRERLAVVATERDALESSQEALREENERLRAALDLCRRVIGTGEPTSDYEARAERFYRVTHMMAPGKSEPLGFVSRYSYEQRRSAWESWAQQELAEARAALAREGAPLTEFTPEKLRSLAREGVELRREVARNYRSPVDGAAGVKLEGDDA